jgi:hypothetical protein
MADYYRLNADKTVTAIDDPARWAEAYEDREARRVGWTTLETGERISTVFLGLNHSIREDGPPLIFETMVFGPDDMMDHFCERYSTYADAVSGHERAVAMVKAHLAAGKTLSDLPYSFEESA